MAFQLAELEGTFKMSPSKAQKFATVCDSLPFSLSPLSSGFLVLSHYTLLVLALNKGCLYIP